MILLETAARLSCYDPADFSGEVLVRAPYHDAQVKILLALVGAVSVGFWMIRDMRAPDWWSPELAGGIGLLAYGVCFWLSGVLDRWLSR